MKGSLKNPLGSYYDLAFDIEGDLKPFMVNYIILFWIFITIENLAVTMKDASIIFRACSIIQIYDHCRVAKKIIIFF